MVFLKSFTVAAALLVATAAGARVDGSRAMSKSRFQTRPGTPAVPNWPSTYDMQASTIVMACNFTGMMNATFFGQFGIVDVDWSNALSLWPAPPMNDEELLVQQAAALKAVNPNIHVFVYRNLVNPMPWFTSVRNVISDPTKNDWFIPFKPNTTYHVPQCDTSYSPPKCTNLYHDQNGAPGYPKGHGNCPGPCECGSVPCGEYLFDHRAGEALRSWIVNDFVLGPTGLGNPNISGYYFDDGWSNVTQPRQSWMPPEGYCDSSPVGGPSEVVWSCINDTGLQQHDTTDLMLSWQDTMAEVFDAVVANGGWAWNLYYQAQTPTSTSQCIAWTRQMCGAGNQSLPYTDAMIHKITPNINGTFSPLPTPQLELDLAHFLMIRGPYAWIGFDWVSCSIEYDFPDLFRADYGTPLQTCVESAPDSGVFVRKYSKANVQLDCNSLTGTITQL